MSYLGYKMSQETREKMKLAKLAKPVRYWKGKKRPDISKLRKGIKLSKEHKEKLRQAKLQNPVKYWKGKTRPNLHSEGWKKELSEKMKGENCIFFGQDMSGSNNPCWIADRTKLKKNGKKHLDSRYKEWMRAVKNRDDWKCKMSNDNCSGRLEAHHILRWSEFSELRYKINNGITLCAFHHPRKKSDEKRLSPYFRELVSKVR